MAAGEPAGVEYITYAKNGAKFWSSLSVTPVHNEAGELEHMVGASRAQRSLSVQSRTDDVPRQLESRWNSCLQNSGAFQKQLIRASR